MAETPSADSSFDVVIVGSGPGGYVAAIRAAQLGLSVACVEADKLGGVCLNIGCIPTKALLSSAFLVNSLKKDSAGHGIFASDLSFDLGPAQARSVEVAGQLSRGVAHLFQKNGVRHLEGFGRLAGNGRVEVEANGSRSSIEARHVIFATGSRPRDLAVLPIDEDRIWSSTGALMQTDAPTSLAVIGAGAVGMEFADVFDAYGSKVTVVEALDRVLPLEDADSSAAVARSFKRRGMDIHVGARLETAQVREDGVSLGVRTREGKELELDVEHVLSAVGRVPNTQDLGLEAAGVATDRNGFIEVDERMRTSASGVYAIGDCAGRQLLAHKASHEGIVAVEHIAGQGHGTVDYGNVPNCTYCDPEVASVGLTEEQARDAGHDIQVGKFPWLGLGRAVAAGHTDGFVKVIRDRRYSEILGVHIVGSHATELIGEFVLGRHLESTVEEMERAMHPHPTLSEGVAEGALAALGRPIHI